MWSRFPITDDLMILTKCWCDVALTNTCNILVFLTPHVIITCSNLVYGYHSSQSQVNIFPISCLGEESKHFSSPKYSGLTQKKKRSQNGSSEGPFSCPQNRIMKKKMAPLCQRGAVFQNGSSEAPFWLHFFSECLIWEGVWQCLYIMCWCHWFFLLVLWLKLHTAVSAESTLQSVVLSCEGLTLIQRVSE